MRANGITFSLFLTLCLSLSLHLIVVVEIDYNQSEPLQLKHPSKEAWQKVMEETQRAYN